jgi:hypothetical protein
MKAVQGLTAATAFGLVGRVPVCRELKGAQVEAVLQEPSRL